MNITKGCRFYNLVANLFQYYLQGAQPVPSPKVQASSTASNTMLNYLPNYRGAYINVHETY